MVAITLVAVIVVIIKVILVHSEVNTYCYFITHKQWVKEWKIWEEFKKDLAIVCFWSKRDTINFPLAIKWIFNIYCNNNTFRLSNHSLHSDLWNRWNLPRSSTLGMDSSPVMGRHDFVFNEPWIQFILSIFRIVPCPLTSEVDFSWQIFYSIMLLSLFHPMLMHCFDG